MAIFYLRAIWLVESNGLFLLFNMSYLSIVINTPCLLLIIMNSVNGPLNVCLIHMVWK